MISARHGCMARRTMMQASTLNTDTMARDVLAVETHTGRVWALVILIAMLGPAVSVFFYPTSPARFVLAIVGVIGVGAFLMAWVGFQYRFLRHGVEIRTLGFRLRVIPKQAIVSYAIEPWAWWRGFGIRGVGNRRAYVWGTRVVHIVTTNGDIYLGHGDPERIVRDLDKVTGFVTRG
jgi:hypothetical protein